MEDSIFKKFEHLSKYIIIVILIVSIIVFGIIIFINLKDKTNDIVEIQEREKIVEEEKEVAKEIKQTKVSNNVIVDVKGEVLLPGIYQVPENARIEDVINIAGGLTNNADTRLTNLSKKVYDEQVIIIYSKVEVEDIINSKKKSIEKEELKCGVGEILLNGKCSTETSNDNSKETKIIDINTASIEELTSIPGIGENKASSIIKYREENGPFRIIDDIKNVTGIGESIYESIKDYIKV